MTEATAVSERQPQDPDSTHRNPGHPPRFLGFVVEREDDLPQPRKWEANPRPTLRNRGWIFGFARAVRQDAWVEIFRPVSQSLGDWETVAPQDDMEFCGGEIKDAAVLRWEPNIPGASSGFWVTATPRPRFQKTEPGAPSALFWVCSGT
jgi:hypothetical protein